MSQQTPIPVKKTGKWYLNKGVLLFAFVTTFLTIAWAGSTIGRFVATGLAVSATAYGGYLIYKGTNNALNGLLGGGLAGMVCFVAGVYDLAGDVGAAVFGLLQGILNTILCISLAASLVVGAIWLANRKTKPANGGGTK